MERKFISIVFLIGIIIGGLVAVQTFSELLGNYAYAKKSHGSQNTADTVSDDSTNSGDNGASNNNTADNNTGDNTATQDTPDSAGLLTADNGIITKSQSDIVMQSMQDDQLVKRIFPLIVDKLDGATILKKVDGQQLLEKVLPYLDVTASVREEEAPESTAKGGTNAILKSQAACGDGEILVSGGFSGNTEVMSSYKQSEKIWGVQGYHPTDIYGSGSIISDLSAIAECLHFEVGIKPIEAPGGSPLLPP